MMCATDALNLPTIFYCHSVQQTEKVPSSCYSSRNIESQTWLGQAQAAKETILILREIF